MTFGFLDTGMLTFLSSSQLDLDYGGVCLRALYEIQGNAIAPKTTYKRENQTHTAGYPKDLLYSDPCRGVQVPE